MIHNNQNGIRNRPNFFSFFNLFYALLVIIHHVLYITIGVIVEHVFYWTRRRLLPLN